MAAIAVTQVSLYPDRHAERYVGGTGKPRGVVERRLKITGVTAGDTAAAVVLGVGSVISAYGGFNESTGAAVGVAIDPVNGRILVALQPASASHRWVPADADDTFFVADQAYRVVGITARVEVAGTDAGAVTAAIKKVASGTDIASGTALHTGTINLKGTVDTNQVLTLSGTPSDLELAAGNAIGIDFTGVLTAARGTVTVALTGGPLNQIVHVIVVGTSKAASAT